MGDGPLRASLQQEHPRHYFAGMRTGEDLAAHYASADVFLFPSVTETFGNVVLEAMASGLAVVAYDYAAAREHIRDGDNGMLAEFDAGERFIAVASELAADTALITQLRANARASIMRASWEQVVYDFEGVLTQVIARSGARF